MTNMPSQRFAKTSIVACITGSLLLPVSIRVHAADLECTRQLRQEKMRCRAGNRISYMALGPLIVMLAGCGGSGDGDNLRIPRADYERAMADYNAAPGNKALILDKQTHQFYRSSGAATVGEAVEGGIKACQGAAGAHRCAVVQQNLERDYDLNPYLYDMNPYAY
jgi:hypothetical protein